MVYFLFDNPADKQGMLFLYEYEETSAYKQIYPEEQCKSVKDMMRFCWRCINSSKPGDVLVCWYDFMGILCWWICKLTHKNRKVIVLNILLKDKGTKKNKLAKMLYKPALKSKSLFATVTSREYGEWLNDLLGVKKKYVLLHDIYHTSSEEGTDIPVIDNSVFCGGRNGRDWEFYFELARKMPDITFNCAMPKETYDQLKDKCSDNVVVKCDIPERNFLKILGQSEMLVMPLDTQAPAGLIVLFQAAANGKMIITSDTVTTREYLDRDRGILCDKNYESWVSAIRMSIGNQSFQEERARKFKKYLMMSCSESRYVKTISKVVNKVGGGITPNIDIGIVYDYFISHSLVEGTAA